MSRLNPRPLFVRAFTLIEMITVVAIMAVIMGMTIGVISSVNTRKGTEGGARMMSRMLELTRQHAIGRGKRVALILAMDDSGNKFSGTSWELEYGEALEEDQGVYMRPCEVDSSGKFLRFVKDTKWERMPDRVYFQLEPAGTLADLTDVPIPRGTSVDNTIAIKGVIFRGTGSLTTATDAGPITIRSTGQSARTYTLTVNWLTGRVNYEHE